MFMLNVSVIQNYNFSDTMFALRVGLVRPLTRMANRAAPPPCFARGLAAAGPQPDVMVKNINVESFFFLLKKKNIIQL